MELLITSEMPRKQSSQSHVSSASSDESETAESYSPLDVLIFESKQGLWRTSQKVRPLLLSGNYGSYLFVALVVWFHSSFGVLTRTLRSLLRY